MRKNEVFPTKYMSASELPEEGTRFTIDYVDMVELGPPDKKERKPAVFFREDPRAFVLNKTNWNTIESNLGSDETEDWTGKKVELYPTLVDFQGKQTLSIRVRADVRAALAKAQGGSRAASASGPATRQTVEPAGIGGRRGGQTSEDGDAGGDQDIPF